MVLAAALESGGKVIHCYAMELPDVACSEDEEFVCIAEHDACGEVTGVN